MKNLETVAKRYATAVFGIASDAKNVSGVGGDLHALATALLDDAGVRRFFLSPVVDRDLKAQTLARVLDGKVGETALNTLLLLVKKRREALLAPLVDAYDALVLAGENREKLEIVSARPLAPADLDAIVARLGTRYGTTFQVRTSVDPALLGGIRITMGDRLIDGSLSGRLDDLARELLAAPV